MTALLSILQHSLSYRIVRLMLAGVFIYAGVVKLADVRGFALVIEEYGLVRGTLLPVVALGLPIAEVVAGIALVFDKKGSLAMVTAMTLLFMAVLGYAMAAGLTIGDCGCFAPGELPEGTADGSALRDAFGRDVGMLAACVYLYWWRRTSSVCSRSSGSRNDSEIITYEEKCS